MSTVHEIIKQVDECPQCDNEPRIFFEPDCKSYVVCCCGGIGTRFDTIEQAIEVWGMHVKSYNLGHSAGAKGVWKEIDSINRGDKWL